MVSWKLVSVCQNFQRKKNSSAPFAVRHLKKKKRKKGHVRGPLLVLVAGEGDIKKNDGGRAPPQSSECQYGVSCGVNPVPRGGSVPANVRLARRNHVPPCDMHGWPTALKQQHQLHQRPSGCSKLLFRYATTSGVKRAVRRDGEEREGERDRDRDRELERANCGTVRQKTLERLGSIFPSWHRSRKCNLSGTLKYFGVEVKKERKNKYQATENLSLCLPDWLRSALNVSGMILVWSQEQLKCVEELSKYWNHRASHSQSYMYHAFPPPLCVCFSPRNAKNSEAPPPPRSVSHGLW